MKDQKHTAEPWVMPYSSDTEAFITSYKLRIRVATFEHGDRDTREANSKRIVQCVNAMAGIDDPQMFVDMANHIIKLWNESKESETK